MNPLDDFDALFKALTGNPPFPWQRTLYERFIAGDIPASCNLPTKLGKTSVVAIWLISLAKQPDKMPRRLVYVVNRRTVVDQTTDEVVKYRQNMRGSALEGELRKLCAIPLRPRAATNGTEQDDSPLVLTAIETGGGGRVAAVESGGAQECRPVNWQDGADVPSTTFVQPIPSARLLQT